MKALRDTVTCARVHREFVPETQSQLKSSWVPDLCSDHASHSPDHKSQTITWANKTYLEYWVNEQWYSNIRVLGWLTNMAGETVKIREMLMQNRLYTVKRNLFMSNACNLSPGRRKLEKRKLEDYNYSMICAMLVQFSKQLNRKLESTQLVFIPDPRQPLTGETQMFLQANTPKSPLPHKTKASTVSLLGIIMHSGKQSQHNSSWKSETRDGNWRLRLLTLETNSSQVF